MGKIDTVLGIDHIGYAVKDLTAARVCFVALGFEFDVEKADELRNVKVCVGKGVGGVRLELLSPLGNGKSPIDGYLNKMGSMPYHICYRVRDICGSAEKLQDMGYTLLGAPMPSVPLGGMVCFLYSVEIGVVELIEKG